MRVPPSQLDNRAASGLLLLAGPSTGDARRGHSFDLTIRLTPTTRKRIPAFCRWKTAIRNLLRIPDPVVWLRQSPTRLPASQSAKPHQRSPDSSGSLIAQGPDEAKVGPVGNSPGK